MERRSIRPSWLNSCPQVIGVAFCVQSVHLKKEEHRWKETGINWPNSLSNQSLCFCDCLMEGADESGGWAPLIGSARLGRTGGRVVMAGEVFAPPHIWYSHCTTVNTDTFVLIIFNLVPCTGPSSAATRLQCSFITPSVYATHFSLLSLTPHTQWLIQELPSTI